MKMFLVGMCDIFLILYLTTLTRIDPRLVSELTVEDYHALKVEEEEIRSRLKRNKKTLGKLESTLALTLAKLEEESKLSASTKKEKDKLSSNLQERAKAVAELQKRIELAKKEKELALKKSADAEKKLAQKSLTLKQIQEKERKTIAQLALSEKALREAKAREVEVKKRSETLNAQVEQASLHATKLESLLDTFEKREHNTQEKLRKLRRREKKARKAEEEAKRQSAEAKKEALRAEEQRVEALAVAEVAQSREKQARDYALASTRSAARSREEAKIARSREVRAIAEADHSRKKVEAVTQSGEKAYQLKIANKLIPVRIEIKSKNLLIGTTTKQSTLNGIPINFSDEVVVFVPRVLAGFDPSISAKRIKKVQITANAKHPAHALIYHPKNPEVFGLVFGSLQIPTLSARGTFSGVHSLMPLLIAVRSQEPSSFGDFLRSTNDTYFIFKRDRLSAKSDGSLIYQAEGIRGTKDFANVVLKGDQIVNLEGNLIGVATERNTIRPIGRLGTWKRISLTNKSGKQIFETLPPLGQSRSK